MCNHISSGVLRIDRETSTLVSCLECEHCSKTLKKTNVGLYIPNPKLGIPLQTVKE